MKQNVPKSLNGLLAFATTNALGAETHEADIGLTHNTAVKINGDIEAVRAAQSNYCYARNDLRAAYDAIAMQTETAQSIATITREILKLKLGKQHSELWIATGFAQSLAMPRSAEELKWLTFFLGNYLAQNPGLEVPALDVTAANLAAISNGLGDAIATVNENLSAVDRLLATRNEKVARLRKRIRDLVAELNQFLEPIDPRWLSFGLNRPGVEESPETPQNIEAIVVNETTALLEFERPARADYYRVYKRVVNVDPEPVYVDSPSDPNFTYENLPRGATIEFYIVAVNSGGDSAMSKPVSVTTLGSSPPVG